MGTGSSPGSASKRGGKRGDGGAAGGGPASCQQVVGMGLREEDVAKVGHCGWLGGKTGRQLGGGRLEAGPAAAAAAAGCRRGRGACAAALAQFLQAPLPAPTADAADAPDAALPPPQVTRNGITCLQFLPTEAALLLAAGDKSGNVGFWHVDRDSGSGDGRCGAALGPAGSAAKAAPARRRGLGPRRAARAHHAPAAPPAAAAPARSSTACCRRSRTAST
jgi:hypothetical protein